MAVQSSAPVRPKYRKDTGRPGKEEGIDQGRFPKSTLPEEQDRRDDQEEIGCGPHILFVHEQCPQEQDREQEAVHEKNARVTLLPCFSPRG